MKKILSFILATAIIISFIPAVFATEGTTIKYDLAKVLEENGFKDGSGKTVSEITKNLTGNLFEFSAVADGKTESSGGSIRFRHYTGNYNIQILKNKWIEFNIYVPEKADYTLDVYYGLYKLNGKVDIYLDGAGTSIGSYDIYAEGKTFNVLSPTPYTVSNVPLGEGWHKIKFATTEGYGSVSTFSLAPIKTAETDEETAFVSIGVDDDGDGKATIKEAALGEEVTVTAADRENMVFRGWVRGSADKGHLVWTEPKYTFTATTHTYLTAIYTPVNATATDEYYHWNGQFLGNDKTTAEANISPIVGYTFAKSWTEAKKENLITSWIANFTKNNDEYAVTGNGFTMTKADNKYDTEVTCTSDNGAVYWYRDNKLVDYGTEYKFFIWDNTTVTTSDKGHNGAKLMLDKKKDNTYMVEYDAGDAKLLEVGILFGDTGETPTVESCKEKMSSQRNINEKGHGQFSATSEYAVARGYLVYQDGSTYRVIYAD